MSGRRTTHIECDGHDPRRDGDCSDDEVSLPDSDAVYRGHHQTGHGGHTRGAHMRRTMRADAKANAR